jgi:hypothetical protein
MTTDLELGGTTGNRRARMLTAVRSSAAERSRGSVGRVLAAVSAAPLRIGEQPRSGLPKYRAFELRRRRAQIAARHALDAGQL